MSDAMGSTPTQEIPRITVSNPQTSTVTQEIPRVPAGPPTYVPLPPRPPRNKFLRFFHWLRHGPAWIAPAALLTCFLGAAGAVVATDPTDDLGPTTCAFKMVTNFDCPGCGGTRAFFYLLHGNIPEAARHHVIALFAAPFLVWLYLSWAIRRVFPSTRDKITQFQVTPTMATSFLLVWGAFWIVRNLPWAPFTALYV